MSVTLEAASLPAALRRPSGCAPVRLRATITIDIEADDFLTAEQVKATVAAEYDNLRRSYPGAELDFRQRKPRTAPRAGLPGLVVDPYLDD
jgi:hypothetical protein